MDEVREELATLAREKRLLQLPAYLWERHAPHCTGACSEPVPVAIDVGGTFVIDCCAFHFAYRAYTMRRGLEATLRDRLKGAA